MPLNLPNPIASLFPAKPPVETRNPTYQETPWYKQFAPSTGLGQGASNPNSQAALANQHTQRNWGRTQSMPFNAVTAAKDFSFLSPYSAGTPILAADIDTPRQELQVPIQIGDNNHDGIPDQSNEWQSVLASHHNYAELNPEIAKSYDIHPTSQGQVAAMAQRASMMFDPRNSPARSQFSQGYTAPIQQFAASNTWQIAAGSDGVSNPRKQPSLKSVSPMTSAAPIPTKMPWDL